jgi:hypothetical protein
MGTFATSWTTGDTIPASELNTISGAWTSYTPTVGGAGWALGNGTATGRYKKIGRVITCNAKVTWGSTSTFGGSSLTISAPVAAVSGMDFVGTLTMQDTGTTTYLGVSYLPSASSTFTLLVANTAGTYATVSTGLTTSVPHTWANTDILWISMVYESAS